MWGERECELVRFWLLLGVRVSVNPWTSKGSCVYMCDKITGGTVYSGAVDRA